MQTVKKHKKKILLGIAVLTGALSLPFLFTKARSLFVNHQFETYTDALFAADVSSNALNLHYTLARPEDAGITDYIVSLGSFHPEQIAAGRIVCENRIAALEAFPYELLSKQNQLTRDILCLSYQTELSPKNQYLLDEYLSPSLGTQAQLPVVLAEYAFRSEQDIQEYLKLLTTVDTYFDGILSFEQLKAQNGTFMSDTTVDRIIAQCSAFIEHSEENYLQSVFEEKLSKMPGLSKEKRMGYTVLHEKLLNEQVLPSYQQLINTLTNLKGNGKNGGGLCGFSGGRAYYEYLLQSNCGLYETIPQLQARLLSQLQTDLNECSELLRHHPEFLTTPTAETPNTPKDAPQEILTSLCQKLENDFPAAPKTSYEVKYVHKDLEAYLSPAFYLTPPIDTLTPNDIYINNHAQLKGSELFTTLAHEGFPGHLYQTLLFAATDPSPIRHLQNMGGYVEGWATYIEPYAYNYLDQDPDRSRLEWLNRSLNLCLFSLLDTGIHYDNWSRQKAASFLSSFGITDTAVQEEIYQVIVEDPSNYLKYYGGYLHFLDLREKSKKQLGEDFDLRTFHKKILETGPCQFPVLERYVLGEE